MWEAFAMTEDTAPPRAGQAASRRPKIGHDIRQKFADGKWHAPETIAEALNADPEHVLETLNGISKNQTYGMRAERRRVHGLPQFRLFKADKQIPLQEIKSKLVPFLQELKVEGRKNMATMSPGTVARLAALILRQIDEWDR